MSISGITGGQNDIGAMLAKIREISNKSTVFAQPSKTSATGGFNAVMSLAKESVGQVNQLQASTDKVKNSYILGDSNVSMSDVVVASQKSKLAFEGLVSVRNKILEAYKEIMNMPV